MIGNHAAKYSDEITLGVGLHYGYGEAQRLYVKRSYILVKLVHRGNKMKNIFYILFFYTVLVFFLPSASSYFLNGKNGL